MGEKNVAVTATGPAWSTKVLVVAVMVSAVCVAIVVVWPDTTGLPKKV